MKTQAQHAAELADAASAIISKLDTLSKDIERHHSDSFFDGMALAASAFSSAVYAASGNLSEDSESPLLVWATHCFSAVSDAVIAEESTLRLYGIGRQPFKIDIPLSVMFDYAIWGVHVSWLSDSYPFPEQFESKLGKVAARHLEIVA